MSWNVTKYHQMSPFVIKCHHVKLKHIQDWFFNVLRPLLILLSKTVISLFTQFSTNSQRDRNPFDVVSHLQEWVATLCTNAITLMSCKCVEHTFFSWSKGRSQVLSKIQSKYSPYTTSLLLNFLRIKIFGHF